MPRPRKKVAASRRDREIRTSPSDKKEEENNDCQRADNRLGMYITKEYELLRLVLSYLPHRDLYNAAKVCKPWKAAVECIQRTRRHLHWLFWHCEQNSVPVEEVPHRLFSEYFFDEPQLCLVFMSTLLSDHRVSCKISKVPCPCPTPDGERCNTWHRVINYVKAELPPECPCVAIEGAGVVGSSTDCSDTLEIEEDNTGYSGIFFPKFPGVSVNVFLLTKPEATQIAKKLFMSPAEVEKVLKLPPKQPIQCLLLFCQNRHSPALDVIVKSLEARQPDEFAIGGGLFEGVRTDAKRGVHIVGVVFSGEGVHAASTVLGHTVVTERDVEERMEMFRAHCVPAPQSFGFMFACVGRGVDWYQQENVESGVFRRHFPKTPLVGFFGNGEIGHTYLPVMALEDTNQRYQRTEAVPYSSTQLSYSTVFVYVSLKQKGSH